LFNHWKEEYRVKGNTIEIEAVLESQAFWKRMGFVHHVYGIYCEIDFDLYDSWDMVLPAVS